MTKSVLSCYVTYLILYFGLDTSAKLLTPLPQPVDASASTFPYTFNPGSNLPHPPDLEFLYI